MRPARTLGFDGDYVILLALRLDSVLGLVVAAFSHAYISVHYFATERPDMRQLRAVADAPRGA